MGVVIGGGGSGGIVLLVCPHCGERQARARVPSETSIECRSCRRAFSYDDGVKAAQRSPPK